MFDGNISSIMTKSYGNAIITSAFLCEKFKVPSLPFEESRKFLSKKTTRKIFIEKGIRVPDSAKINSKKIADQFPIVAKPQKGHAKADVKLIHNENEFKKFIKTHEKNEFIFEKFIPGKEIICAGLIENRKYYHILMSDKKTTPHPYFVDLIHTTPSKFIHLTDKTIQIGQIIADTFNIQTSPMIMEFIVDENEELHLLEAVPEFGGEFIPDIMVPAATGYNHLAGAIKAVTDESAKKPQKGTVPYPVVVKYITGENGILSSCSTDTVKLMPDILFTRIFKTIGSRIKSPEMNHDRIGVIAARGKTIEHAMENAIAAEEKMNIRIKPDEQ
jgi:biotin carboxylase